MRLMYDSTVAANIPADAVMVAAYIDGRYAWSAADWARFPNAVKVRIAVNPATNDGHVLDVEPGNWNAAASVDWTIMRRAAGLPTPTVYCGIWASGYTWQNVLDAHAARGVSPPLIWVANYDGIQQLPAGAIAKQYADATMLGIGADASVVADLWPGVDAPLPIPTPTPIPPNATNVAAAQSALAVAADDIANAVADLNGASDIPSATGRTHSAIAELQQVLADLGAA